MNFILCLGIVFTIFTTSHSLECYNCFEGSLLKNKMHLPAGTDGINIRPTERCIRRDGEIIGPKCMGQNVCIKSDTITGGEAVILRFCSAVEIPQVNEDVHQRSENEYVTSEVNMCLTDLCNSGHLIVYSASLAITLLVALLIV